MAQAKRTIAVIGCGYWGRNLVRNMAGLGALAAVCDPHAETAAAQAREYGVAAQSLDAILTDKTIEGVVIAAPAAQHAALAERALKAGKHVFVEKPLALTVKEAEALATLAAEKKRVLMVGHLLQYHPAYLKLKELALEGALGKLRHVASSRMSYGKIRTEENVLWSFAPHDISMLLGLFGALPQEVAAQGSAFATDGIADIVTTQLHFASGASASVHVSWLNPVKEQKLVVIGEKASVVFDDTLGWEQKLTLFPNQVEKGSTPTAVKGEAKPIALEAAEPLKAECQHFLDAMAGKPVRTDAAEAITVLKVLEAAEKAMTSGKPVKLNANVPAGVFVHDTAVIDEGVTIGKGSKVWHFSHILGGCTIGEDCIIGQNVMIGPDVVIGNQCKIQNNVSLYKGVTLEDGVFCGPSCVFTNVNTPRAAIERKNEYRATRVGKWATIGANATIVCGHDLGEYCLIGAGAVVTKHVKPHALMAGNPATQIGWVSHAGEKLTDKLTCPREGRQYRVSKAGELEEILLKQKRA